MSEVINWRAEEHEQSLTGWFILHAITEAGLMTPDLWPEGKFDPTTVEVDLRINGAKMSFRKCMEDLDKHMDRQTIAVAERIASDKFDLALRSLRDTLDEAEGQFRRSVQEQLGMKVDLSERAEEEAPEVIRGLLSMLTELTNDGDVLETVVDADERVEKARKWLEVWG